MSGARWRVHEGVYMMERCYVWMKEAYNQEASWICSKRTHGCSMREVESVVMMLESESCLKVMGRSRERDTNECSSVLVVMHREREDMKCLSSPMLRPIEKELVLSRPGLHLTCEYTRESQGLLGCPREIGICLKIGIKMTASKQNFYKLYLISLTLPLHVSDFLSFSSILWTVITRPSENSGTTTIEQMERFKSGQIIIDLALAKGIKLKTYHYFLIRVWRYSTGSKRSPTFQHSPAITLASPTPKGSEAYWFYALGACLLLHLVHRLGYKNSSTMSFLPDLWTKSACWNQRALKLVLAISLEEEMLRREEREAAEGAELKLQFEMTRVVALLDCSSIHALTALNERSTLHDNFGLRMLDPQ
ncbi:hypothetical protein VNO77_19001 [Canavalia gladiata]|uniref:Uncharacterized protein n=1 Tax=Canavalia gladiata TaxID=3824 RepID=A0AAN9LQ85_CANGL